MIGSTLAAWRSATVLMEAGANLRFRYAPNKCETNGSLCPKLRHQERHAVSHEARDEMQVARKAVQLGHSHRAALTSGLAEGCCKLCDLTDDNQLVYEPIRKVWIYGEAFAASRLSMMRIMARRMNAATVVA